MAKHGIRSWRSWIEGKDEMTIKDSIIRRNADGSFLHYGAPVPLFGRARDAAPTGSEVGGVGENSLAYREYNQTNRPIAGSEARRGDGAIRDILACWPADSETEIVEEAGLKYLVRWTRLQSGEGVPEGAITGRLTGRSATTMNDPEQIFADPPVGPRAAARDAHRQMFDRLTDHNSKKPLVARRALAAIKRSTDTMESINAENAKFWGGKK